MLFYSYFHFVLLLTVFSSLTFSINPNPNPKHLNPNDDEAKDTDKDKDKDKSECFSSTAATIPPIYWINMDKSKDRAKHFETMVKALGIQIQARVSGQDVNSVAFKIHKVFPQIRAHMEHAITISHLKAIEKAVEKAAEYNTKYAIICEDDVKFIYDIDYTKLIDEAPKDFAILQLATVNRRLIEHELHTYNENKGAVFWTQHQLESHQLTPDPTHTAWGLQAYLINTEKIIENHGLKHAFHKITVEKEAGYKLNYAPHKLTPMCSWLRNRQCNITVVMNPEVLIYQNYFTPTYLSSIPLINAMSFKSTIHVDHDNTATLARRKIDEIAGNISIGYQTIYPDFIIKHDPIRCKVEV